MKNVFFGLALQYDDGVRTQVAMNANGTIVEVHKSQSFDKLWYHVGSVDKMNVRWSRSAEYDSGVTPSVALNRQNKVVEVHKSEWNSGLWYHVGTVSGTQIVWATSRKYDSGVTPKVAMNDAGVIVEVHQSESNSGLWYHVGALNGDSVSWSGSQRYDSGTTPSVAINNHGVVVEVHKSEWNSGLWYHVGRVNGSSVNWGPSVNYDTGVFPSVAITDAGDVIEVHQSQAAGTLWQRFGRINGDRIDWVGGAVNFDDGTTPSVACAGGMAIQTHQSENFATLWSSTSLIVDRASWMQDNLAALQNKTLSTLTAGASHDAGMYLGDGLNIFGKTQDLDLYGQLSNGIRYFDLRPLWDGSDFYLYHGFSLIKGPKLSVVLADIARFMNEGHRELVTLKFSHYKDIDDATYRKLTKLIQDQLDRWLYKTLPAGKRLADITLGSYLAGAGVVLAVCDGGFPVNNPATGIWVYRDWESPTAAQGDLRVFDQYSDTTDYEKMKNDQLAKFARYNGKCKDDPNLPCDQFLLSWTLTPVTAVWPYSKEANRNLGAVMAGLKVPNGQGCIPNLLYVDYVEYARVTDVAMFQNGVAGFGK